MTTNSILLKAATLTTLLAASSANAGIIYTDGKVIRTYASEAPESKDFNNGYDHRLTKTENIDLNADGIIDYTIDFTTEVSEGYFGQDPDYYKAKSVGHEWWTIKAASGSNNAIAFHDKYTDNALNFSYFNYWGDNSEETTFHQDLLWKTQDYKGFWATYEHTLGLRFEIDNKSHFGWIQLSRENPDRYGGFGIDDDYVPTPEYSSVQYIGGYAFESVAGVGIIANEKTISLVPVAVNPINPVAVSEPGSYALLALGVAGALSMRRRKAAFKFKSVAAA